MKLRIESDGTPHGSKVTDEDGNLVERVVRVRVWWECGVDSMARPMIEVIGVPVDVIGDDGPIDDEPPF